MTERKLTPKKEQINNKMTQRSQLSPNKQLYAKGKWKRKLTQQEIKGLGFEERQDYMNSIISNEVIEETTTYKHKFKHDFRALVPELRDALYTIIPTLRAAAKGKLSAEKERDQAYLMARGYVLVNLLIEKSPKSVKSCDKK